MTFEEKMTKIGKRMDILKMMDDEVRGWGDEELLEPWLMVGVPDAATEDDFMYIASDDEVYNEVTAEFNKLKELYENER